jgi:hypothetical protein
MRHALNPPPQPRPTMLIVAAVISVAGAGMALGTGCGGSEGGLTPGSVTKCEATTCTGPRPTNAAVVCPDDSMAGPACIQHADGTCGWAVLTCPIERGPTGHGGAKAGGGGAGGRVASGGPGGSSPGGSPGFGGNGGRATPTGGVIGAGGGGSETGGAIGTGGDIATGGTFGTGGSLGTGGSGTGGTGRSGSFSWTANGQSSSTSGYYEENLALSGTSFIITIAADGFGSAGTPCALTGQFAVVPPPPGTYLVADATIPQADGTFVGHCSSIGLPPPYSDQSVSGQVVLSDSKAGLVEGSFSMHARDSLGSTGLPLGSLVTYTGAFSVGCRDARPTTEPACATRSILP